MLLLKKMVLIVSIFVSVFCYVVFSDNVNTRYTDFYFMSGTETTSSIQINLTGGVTGHVNIGLENHSDSLFPLNISFVDSQIVNFGSTGVRVCLSDSERDEVGQYVSLDNPYSIVMANTGIVKQLDLLFPAWYSGFYYGCVVYSPLISESGDHLNTLPRKAIFLDVNVKSTYKDFDLTVRPAYRTDGGDYYGFSGADFWLFEEDQGVWHSLYNSAIGGDDKVNTDDDGIGVVSVLPPDSGSMYLVAFKGSGSLSVGYTGIWDDTIDSFNMFSGVMANGMSTGFVIKYYDGLDTGNYLRMGDIVADNSGNYDLIKDADFSMMTYNLTKILNPNHPDWFDLDLNGIINTLDQTMVADSYTHRGFISLQNDILLSDFVNM